jgi:beta-lactamase class A
MGRKTLRIVSIGAAIIIVLSVGFALGRSTIKSSPQTNATSVNSDKYNLLARRILIENPNDAWINFSPLRDQLAKYVTQNKLVVGLYFEYLPTGTSQNINSEKDEVAASLLKLPAAMDLYKAAELGRVDLDQIITLQPEWLDSDYGTLYQKGAGYKLSLRQAAQIMLEESDNTALKAVATYISNKLNENENVLASIDTPYKVNPDQTVSVDARSYNSAIKCLYFACFNNKEDSQEILTYLSRSTARDRIVAGVNNPDITIAHKIGTYNDAVQSDCGIVYVPKRNYTICIMLQGPEGFVSNSHIAALSKIVYDFVKNIPGQ